MADETPQAESIPESEPEPSTPPTPEATPQDRLAELEAGYRAIREKCASVAKHPPNEHAAEYAAYRALIASKGDAMRQIVAMRRTLGIK